MTVYVVELWMDVGDYESVAYMAMDRTADDATAAAQDVMDSLFRDGNGGFTRQEIVSYRVTRKKLHVRPNLLQRATDFH